MVSLGVWACRYRELRPISFGGPATKDVPKPLANGTAEPDEHVRGGRGRGRARDEGPSYEMVTVQEGSDSV